MDLLKKCLNGEGLTFSLENIAELVQHYVNCKIESDRYLLNFYINKGLETKIINPNMFLSVSIMEVRRYIDLPLIIFALRGGANVNLYLRSTIGSCHILIYTIIQLRELKREPIFIDTICIILILLGSHVSSRAFDVNGGILPNRTSSDLQLELQVEESLDIKYREKSNETVETWLRQQNMFFNDIKKVTDSLNDKYRLLIGGLTDRYDILKDCYPIESNIILVQAVNISSRIKEFVNISRCIQAPCFALFKASVDKGCEVTYYNVNKLCVYIKYCHNDKNTILAKEQLLI